ncbi:MAG: hypothetical protein J0L78_12220 [Planctomycetes bacterium]|nr:hypothetical protein [Planctomycetota bacterium]
MMTLLAQADAGNFLNQVMEKGYFPWLLVVGGIVVCSIAKHTASAIKGVAKERTRREIAAFIAEGSMSPEQGEKLMKAGKGGSIC